jgi:hypothetical protein
LSYSNYSLPLDINQNLFVIHSTYPGLPRFVKFNYPEYFFHPEKLSDIGIFTINGELCNDYLKLDFSFKVNVTNKAPYFLEKKLIDLKVPIKTLFTFNFSEGIDREG